MKKNLTISFLLILSFAISCSDKSDSTQANANAANSKTTGNPQELSTEPMNADAVVTTSLTLRSKPDVNSAKVVCLEILHEWPENQTGWNCYSGGCDREISALPQGAHISVIEKTKDTVEVEKWNNHWYRINSTAEINDTRRVQCYDKQGNELTPWVYGEFIKIN